MRIRAAEDGDRDGIDALLRQLHPGVEGRSLLPTVRQEARTFVAEQAGALVGTVVVTFVDDGFESYGMIEELIIDPAHRGNGIGTTLVEQARTWCFDLAAEVVFVPAYAEAESFYRAIGFAPCTGAWLYTAPNTAQNTVPG